MGASSGSSAPPSPSPSSAAAGCPEAWPWPAAPKAAGVVCPKTNGDAPAKRPPPAPAPNWKFAVAPEPLAGPNKLEEADAAGAFEEPKLVPDPNLKRPEVLGFVPLLLFVPLLVSDEPELAQVKVKFDAADDAEELLAGDPSENTDVVADEAVVVPVEAGPGASEALASDGAEERTPGLRLRVGDHVGAEEGDADAEEDESDLNNEDAADEADRWKGEAEVGVEIEAAGDSTALAPPLPDGGADGAGIR